MLVAHFYPPASSSDGGLSIHGQRMMADGTLFDCPDDWVNVIEFYPKMPSFHLLMAIHQLSLLGQKGHIIITITNRVLKEVIRSMFLTFSVASPRYISKSGCFY
jgi:hypothetical protein